MLIAPLHNQLFLGSDQLILHARRVRAALELELVARSGLELLGKLVAPARQAIHVISNLQNTTQESLN